MGSARDNRDEFGDAPCQDCINRYCNQGGRFKNSSCFCSGSYSIPKNSLERENEKTGKRINKSNESAQCSKQFAE